ncbi:MAG: FAD:protein FMN transferase [Rhodothermales bacterium]|nr:FAD:protein FMN transferase [Rhodothermales bacterium]
MKSTRRSFLKSAGALTGGLVVSGFHSASARGLFSEDLTSRTLWAMGMPVRYSVPPEASSSIAKSFAAVTRIDEHLSIYKPESAVSRLNLGLSVADIDLVKVCKAARQFGELTEGYLDVTVLPVLRNLGFRPGELSPSSTSHIDFRKLRVTDSDVHTVGNVQVDLGGIAKGYAVDEATRELRGEQVESGLIEAGGDIYALGSRPDGSSWTIGIRDPRNPARLFATVRLTNSAVATSGGYFDSHVVNGSDASHLINPKTGESVSHVLSATIVAPSAMTADALATATSVQPRAQAQALIESLKEVEGVWIYSDGSIFVTPGLRDKITLL